MKKILFPTDFSPTAINAFEYALALAEDLDATIDLMTVYHLPVADASSVPPQYVERMLEEKRQAVGEQVHDFLRNYPPERIGQTRTDYGVFTYQEIVDAARQGKYELIIMGAKGEHNPVEKLLGSVTTLTMLHAPCPVLAVPADAQYEPIEHIAFATDFEPSDEHAVEDLFDLAGQLGAAVHFVHVNTGGREDTDIEEAVFGGESPFPFHDFTVVNSPSAVDGVERYAEKEQVDLLALFIPRRRLWERLFHSSFSKKLAFHSKLPVLAFH